MSRHHPLTSQFSILHGNAPINTDIPPKSFLIFTGGYIDNVRVWTSPLIFRVFVSILLGFLTGDIFHSGYYRSCTEWTRGLLLLVIHMYGVDLTVAEANRVSGLMLPVGDYRRSVRVFGAILNQIFDTYWKRNYHAWVVKNQPPDVPPPYDKGSTI